MACAREPIRSVEPAARLPRGRQGLLRGARRQSTSGADGTRHPHTCLDCGAALTDRYCAHCGQPADTHRITLKHLLLHDLPHSVWHVDKGIAYTFYRMLTRPGLTIRGYLAGQRTRQFRPVSYLLLLAVVVCIAAITVQVLRERPDLRPNAALKQPRAAATR